MPGCPVFDLTAPETYSGGMPREVFKYLRNEQPIYWHEDPVQQRGFWAVTRHSDLDFISKNPLLFSSEAETCFLHEQDPGMLEMMRLLMINMDPPRHIKYRRLVRNAFTPKAELFVPDVLNNNVFTPKAELLPPKVYSIELAPKAELLLPVVFNVKAPFPKAELL